MFTKSAFIQELKKIQIRTPMYCVFRDEFDIPYTAEQMIDEIEKDSPVSKDYRNKFEKLVFKKW